jgi:PPM family protein phosphatase
LSWFSKSRKKEETAPQPSQAPFLHEPEAVLLSDQGCHRTNNQDSGKIVHASNGNPAARGLLVIVADGMGGHKAGEVASQTAVKVIAEVYQSAKGTPGEALEKAFQEANRDILQQATRNAEMAGMGTTCTALAIVGHEAWAAHVGDSRLYLVRGDSIYQLSEDHTAIQEMVRQGLLSAEEAEHHEDRNVLLRAMGTKPEMTIMRWPEPMDVREGDAFLLCSDGLHDLVADAEMMSVMKGASPGDACRKLIQMAKDRGGYDNITVAAVAIYSIKDQADALKETRAVEVPQ